MFLYSFCLLHNQLDIQDNKSSPGPLLASPTISEEYGRQNESFEQKNQLSFYTNLSKFPFFETIVNSFNLSINKFKSMIEDNKFVEWAIVHGNYYGTSRREIEKKGTRNNLLLDLDVQGAQKARERFKKAVFIFILPPGFLELKNRLEKSVSRARKYEHLFR